MIFIIHLCRGGTAQRRLLLCRHMLDEFAMSSENESDVHVDAESPIKKVSIVVEVSYLHFYTNNGVSLNCLKRIQ